MEQSAIIRSGWKETIIYKPDSIHNSSLLRRFILEELGENVDSLVYDIYISLCSIKV